jgi:hypothetical protein
MQNRVSIVSGRTATGPSSGVVENEDVAIGNLSPAVGSGELNELIRAHKSTLAFGSFLPGYEIAARRQLLIYRVKSKKEALDKLSYVTAFLLYAKAALEEEELVDLLATVELSD